MIIDRSRPQTLGVKKKSVLRFGEVPKSPGMWAGRRALMAVDRPLFELSFWCGTCPFLFERLDSGADRVVEDIHFTGRLANGLTAVDEEVVTHFSSLLPRATYIPLLLEVTPRLVEPSGSDDYFAHEQIATFLGPTHDPKTH